MTLVISFLTNPTTQALAWTLVHFLWQGALLAVAAAAVMRWVAPAARARYAVGVMTLAAMLAAPVATFVLLRPAALVNVSAAAGQVALVNPLGLDRPDAAIGDDSRAPAIQRGTPALLLVVVVVWLGGVLILSVRLLGGWIVARRLATGTERPVDAHVQDLASRVAHRLNLHRLVRIAESSAVAVPIVVGWLKPVVLVPAAALSGLSPTHLEALLAHELAHIRRQDYLVNLLQSVVETLLFYHPGVWWVSSRVRVEREHCCDDLAVTVCDRFVYVDALTDLAAMTVHPRLALAATDGPLLRRIRRLLESGADERPAAGWLSIGVVVMLAAGLTPAVLALGRADDQIPAAPRAAVAPATTVPVAGPSAAPRVAVPASAATTSLPLTVTADAVTYVAAVPPTPAVTSAATASPASPMPDQGAGTAAEQARRKELEAGVAALQQQLIAVEAQLGGLTQQRRQVEEEKAREEIRARREAVAEKVEALRKALANETTRHEIGLVPAEAVAEVRAQLSAVERELRGIDTESVSRAMASSIDARKAELETVYVRLQQELAARAQASVALAQLNLAQRQLADARTRYVADHPDRLRLEALVRELQAKAAAEQGPANQLTPPPPQPPAPVQIIRVGGDVKYPRIQKQIQPEYPAIARAAKIQGNVYLEMIIATDGRVRDARVAAGNTMLADPALEAVKQWVYTPTLLNGQPVEVQLTVVVTFKLDGTPAAVPVADPSTLVRAGDVLAIDIAGEDQLPRTYVVEAGGTIRLPLIGRLPVVDLTASQARDVIAKALADRRLAEGRSVSVELRRPN